MTSNRRGRNTLILPFTPFFFKSDDSCPEWKLLIICKRLMLFYVGGRSGLLKVLNEYYEDAENFVTFHNGHLRKVENMLMLKHDHAKNHYHKEVRL